MKKMMSGLLQSLFIVPSLLTMAQIASATPPPDWAVTAEQVDKSACRYPVAQTDQEIQKYFSQKEKNSETQDIELTGFSFRGEYSFYINLLKELLEKDLMNQSENSVDPVVLEAQKSCNKVLCAVEKIFGAKQAWKTLYLLDRFDLNTSYIRFYETSPMTTANLDGILNTLTFVPTHLFPLNHNQMLTHVDRTSKSNNLGTKSDASISLFNGWDRESKSRQAYLLFHEFAHRWSEHGIGEFVEYDESDEWLAITSWVKTASSMAYIWSHKDKYAKDDPNLIWISNYARNNSPEDFAESVSAYRFDPKRLEKLSPTRYAFIKQKVFGGIEFKNNLSCTLNKTTREQQVEVEALKKLEAPTHFYSKKTGKAETMPLRQLLEEQCLGSLVGAVYKKPGSFQEFNQCFANLLLKEFPSAYEWPFVDKVGGTTNFKMNLAKKSFIDEILKRYFVTKKAKTIMWTKDTVGSCKTFANSLRGFTAINSPLITETDSAKYQAVSQLAYAVGYHVCEDTLRGQKKTYTLDKNALQPFLKDLYFSLGVIN